MEGGVGRLRETSPCNPRAALRWVQSLLQEFRDSGRTSWSVPQRSEAHGKPVWLFHPNRVKQLNFPSFQNESELFGRTIRVNLAKPMRIKEGSSRPGEWGDHRFPIMSSSVALVVFLSLLPGSGSWVPLPVNRGSWWARATFVGNKKSLSFSG